MNTNQIQWTFIGIVVVDQFRCTCICFIYTVISEKDKMLNVYAPTTSFIGQAS